MKHRFVFFTRKKYSELCVVSKLLQRPLRFFSLVEMDKHGCNLRHFCLDLPWTPGLIKIGKVKEKDLTLPEVWHSALSSFHFPDSFLCSLDLADLIDRGKPVTFSRSRCLISTLLAINKLAGFKIGKFN